MFQSLSYDLKEVLKLFRKGNVLQLRGLSNRLIREASVENNLAKAELGVISYALHKLETKNHIINNPKWHKVRKNVFTNLEGAIFAINNNQKELFFKKLKKIILDINKIDANLGNFAQGIYDKAKVKQASLAYSYGLSISKAAEITGADKKELQSYIGFTTMHDEENEQKSIKERVTELKKLLVIE